MGHDLIHVVDTRGEVVVLAERLDLPLRVAQDVLFVALGMLVAKLTLHDIREGVWQLRLASEDAPDEGWPGNADAFNAPEARCTIKAVLDERLKVELQVQPDAFEDHSRWYPAMHVLPLNVIFAVCILGTSVED